MLIENTIKFVKETLADAEGGHDWWHVYRVWKMSITLSKDEPVNMEIVQLGALLHDIADSKFYGGDETIGSRKAREFLESQKVSEDTICHVEKIINNISYKGGNFIQSFRSPELDIVQDSDRLDAIGAIGIARTFNYGGFKNREMYNPDIQPNPTMTTEEYKASNAPTINHFYEKLLLLKEKMNTPKGRAIAEQRHQYMVHYLEEFYNEWEGER